MLKCYVLTSVEVDDIRPWTGICRRKYFRRFAVPRCSTKPSAPRSTKLMGPFALPSGVPKSSVHGL